MSFATLLTMLTLDTWLSWYLPGFSSAKLLFFPLSLRNILSTLNLVYFLNTE